MMNANLLAVLEKNIRTVALQTSLKINVKMSGMI